MIPAKHKVAMDVFQKYNLFKGRQRADPDFGEDLDRIGYNREDREHFEK